MNSLIIKSLNVGALAFSLGGLAYLTHNFQSFWEGSKKFFKSEKNDATATAPATATATAPAIDAATSEKSQGDTANASAISGYFLLGYLFLAILTLLLVAYLMYVLIVKTNSKTIFGSDNNESKISEEMDIEDDNDDAQTSAFENDTQDK